MKCRLEQGRKLKYLDKKMNLYYSNRKFQREYELIQRKKEGSGFHGSVYKAKEFSTGRRIAVKVIFTQIYKDPKTSNPTPHEETIHSFEKQKPLQPENISKVLEEIRKSDQARSLNLSIDPVVHIHNYWLEEISEELFEGYDIFEDDSNLRKVYRTIVFVTMELGVSDLKQCLKESYLPLPTFEISCRILINLARTLCRMKEEGLSHGDLKLDNLIVLDIEKAYTHQRGICFSDFGVSGTKNLQSNEKISDIEGFIDMVIELSGFCEELDKNLPELKNLKELEEIEEHIIEKSGVDITKLYFVPSNCAPLFHHQMKQIDHQKKRIDNLEEEVKSLKIDLENVKRMNRVYLKIIEANKIDIEVFLKEI